MLTKRFPMVQFKKDTWEIDEFDVASMFLLVGSERALLIDLGMGIGDLRGAVEMITDKPVTVVVSHGHIDHTGHGRQFEEIYMHPNDQGLPIPQSLERRRFDTEAIAQRNKGCVGKPYIMFNLYPYDINVDLHEPYPHEKPPVVRNLYDGQRFDLGDGRIVTTFECFGHSKGEMVFLDESTRTLFAGDALNFNLGVSAVPAETTLRYLKRLRDEFGPRYDDIYNGHHDFRAFGDPLDDDCLPTVITMLEELLKGNYSPVTLPSAWGAKLPTSKGSKGPSNVVMPPMNPGVPQPQITRTMLQRGRNILGVDLNNLYEKKE